MARHRDNAAGHGRERHQGQVKMDQEEREHRREGVSATGRGAKLGQHSRQPQGDMTAAR